MFKQKFNWLIGLADRLVNGPRKLRGQNAYVFGSKIVYLTEFKDRLFVATENAIYEFDPEADKIRKIKVEIEKAKE